MQDYNNRAVAILVFSLYAITVLCRDQLSRNNNDASSLGTTRVVHLRNDLTANMSISQQLVRKLLKAHASSPNDDSERLTANKSSNRKRKKDAMGILHHNDRVASEDDIVKWHAKFLRTTDRAMAASFDMNNKSSKSNAAAFHKLVQRREQALSAIEKQKEIAANVNPGTARSSTSTMSQSSLVKIPTFNKERYEKERKEKKRMKLAEALEKMHARGVKTKKRKPKKTIFG